MRAKTVSVMVTVVIIGLLSVTALAVIEPLQDPLRQTGAEPRDMARELEMKIPGSFTLASVGDLIIMRPASQREDTGLQAAIKLLRDADVAFGNFETSIADMDNFDGPMRSFMGTKEVASDIKAMGFDLVSRATNHLLDSEIEGMWSTNRLLAAAGVAYAGSGKDLDAARSPRYLETPKGRIGLVAMHSPIDNGGRLAATRAFAGAGARAGLNPLNLNVSYGVTTEHLEALRKIRDDLFKAPAGMTNPVPVPANDSKTRLQLFGATYEVGPEPGTKKHVMNPDDLRENLRSIRSGKQFSDFMISTIHAHQGPWIAQRWAFEDGTPDFLIELAHKSIDNGADAFVGHGPHVLRGIEIYKNKPIFYGLGEFFREEDWAVNDLSSYRRAGATDPLRTELTDADIARRIWTMHPDLYESVIALSRYAEGRLVEVRLYPVDLRYDEPLSRTGTPRIASPAVGRKILERLQRLSQPFGTRIAIDNNIGVIQVESKQTISGVR